MASEPPAEQVPVDFAADVTHIVDGILGAPEQRTLFSGDLALLAHEARWFAWSRAALHLIESARARVDASPSKDEQANRSRRVLLFTGHRVDDEDRIAKGRTPRFPRTPQAEDAARDAIAASIQRALGSPRDVAFGIAGGASGGDILFHETCKQAGI